MMFDLGMESNIYNIQDSDNSGRMGRSMVEIWCIIKYKICMIQQY